MLRCVRLRFGTKHSESTEHRHLPPTIWPAGWRAGNSRQHPSACVCGEARLSLRACGARASPRAQGPIRGTPAQGRSASSGRRRWGAGQRQTCKPDNIHPQRYISVACQGLSAGGGGGGPVCVLPNPGPCWASLPHHEESHGPATGSASCSFLELSDGLLKPELEVGLAPPGDSWQSSRKSSVTRYLFSRVYSLRCYGL